MSKFHRGLAFIGVGLALTAPVGQAVVDLSQQSQSSAMLGLLLIFAAGVMDIATCRGSQTAVEEFEKRLTRETAEAE